MNLKQKQVQQTELTYGGLYDSKFKHWICEWSGVFFL